MPSVIPYCYGTKQVTKVGLSNITTNNVVIQPPAILCELQPVTVHVEGTIGRQQVDNNLDSIPSSFIDLTPEAISKRKEFLLNYKDVFLKNNLVILLLSNTELI